MSFGFYTTHSVGFFIKKSQLKVDFNDLKYNYSADYDLFLRMIKKYKLNGLSTKKVVSENLDQVVFPKINFRLSNRM